MFQQLRKARQDEGFTLIELLIVIIVLGILVAIVLFSLGTFKSDSNQSACKADVKQVQTAATAYLAKTGGWPADVAALSKYLQSTSFPASYAIAVNDSNTGVTGSCDSL